MIQAFTENWVDDNLWRYAVEESWKRIENLFVDTHSPIVKKMTETANQIRTTLGTYDKIVIFLELMRGLVLEDLSEAVKGAQ